MYSKIAFLILLNTVLAIAENNCDCSQVTLEQSLQETNDIVVFLKRLSETAPTEEDKYPVYPPGVISGSLGCQCENLRRKRKITPKEDIPLIEEPLKNFEEVRFSTRNCPKGYIRVNKGCISAEILDY